MVTHSEGDYGPCLTMTLAIKDPESGAYNAAFIKASTTSRTRFAHHHPLDRQRAGPEVLRGSRPADADRRHPRSPSCVLYLGTMGLTAYESDDYSSIGSYLGEPLRLVPSETWVRTSWSRRRRDPHRGVVPPHASG